MKKCFFVLCIVVSNMAIALPEVGKELPYLAIEDKGELVLNDDNIDLQPWSTQQLKGSGWTLLHYLAARPAASKMNRHVVEHVSNTFDKDVVKSVNIVNVNDAPFWAAGLVMLGIEKQKKQHPMSTIIADLDKGVQTWGLNTESSVIMLLDENNTVKFIKDGPIEEGELARIDEILAASQSTTESHSEPTE